MLFYILAQSTSHDSDIVKYLNKRGVLNLYKEIAPLQRLLTVAEGSQSNCSAQNADQCLASNVTDRLQSRSTVSADSKRQQHTTEIDHPKQRNHFVRLH